MSVSLVGTTVAVVVSGVSLLLEETGGCLGLLLLITVESLVEDAKLSVVVTTMSFLAAVADTPRLAAASVATGTAAPAPDVAAAEVEVDAVELVVVATAAAANFGATHLSFAPVLNSGCEKAQPGVRQAPPYLHGWKQKTDSWEASQSL